MAVAWTCFVLVVLLTKRAVDVLVALALMVEVAVVETTTLVDTVEVRVAVACLTVVEETVVGRTTVEVLTEETTLVVVVRARTTDTEVVVALTVEV